MDASDSASQPDLSADRWVTHVLSYKVGHSHTMIGGTSSKSNISSSLHQAEGVQVLPVCGVPVAACPVGEDADSHGRRQQAAAEAVHGGRGPRRFGSHAGRQPSHGGRRNRLPHLTGGRGRFDCF